MARIRIGAVSFLNTRPLVHGLPAVGPDHQLSFDTPGNLAEKLRMGEIDVGLVPIVEHLRGVGDSFVPGIGIASDGPVRTVKLYSRVAPENLRDVAVDGRSRTSVAMLRILLVERYGVVPDFYCHRPDLAEMLRTHDGALLIGDTAFQEGGALHVVDLGTAWKELTGLPFVYAVWVLNQGVDRERAAALLRESLASGLAHLDEIALQTAGTQGQDAPAILAYLRDNLHFVLGGRDLQGIETFQRFCQRYNLISASAPSRLAIAARA